MPPLHRIAACPGCGRQFDLSAERELPSAAEDGSFPCSCGATVPVPSGRSEDAAVVACSSCGAPRQGTAAACAFCGSTFTLRELDLDAICPRCMARVSRRGRFCHHCSLPLTAPSGGGRAATRFACPSCSPAAGGAADGKLPDRLLVSRRIAADDPLHLFECDVCAGVWLDREVFSALVERARRGRTALPPRPAAAAEASASPSDADAPGHWRYRPCPVCGALMLRRNYARRSGVILDLCGDHGIWFDGDELHRVLTWVQGGGSTHREVEEADREREKRRRTAAGGGLAPATGFPVGGSYRRGVGEGAAGWLLEGVAWLVDALIDTRWR